MAISLAVLAAGAGVSRAELDYLGQPPPGDAPEVFAPGLVSTGWDELNAVFSPDGDVFVFAVKLPRERTHTLMLMTRGASGWSEPAVAPFSGEHSDADPAFSADGRELFFISTRPGPGETEPGTWNIWVVAREEEGWSEPRQLAAPVKSEAMEIHPSLASDGTLYFSSARPGGFGRNDIYRAEPLADGSGYAQPVNLGPAINSSGGEGDLFVARDESYLVFVSRRPDSLGGADLYISFRRPDGTWTLARNMGARVNSEATEYCPAVSPDGRFLFFTSYRRRADLVAGPLTRGRIAEIYASPRNGLGDVFWMRASVIDELRAQVSLAAEDPVLTLHGGPPPGAEPTLFAPRVVSTDARELNAVLSPKGDALYFTRRLPGNLYAIMVTELRGGAWTPPAPADFSGEHTDVDPCLSADGRRVLFGSRRPGNVGEADIWSSVKTSAGWAAPENLGPPINTAGNENYPSMTDDGVLVFHSAGHAGHGASDIFMARPTPDGGWAAPENLDPPVSTAHNEFDAFISRDGSYLIFASSGRSDSHGNADLYLSRRQADGSWGEPRNLHALNSPSIDYCPRVSPDGRWLFFTSGRSGEGDVYWVDFEAVLSSLGSREPGVRSE